MTEFITIMQVPVCLLASDLLDMFGYAYINIIMQWFVRQLLNLSIYVICLSVSHLVSQSVCLSVT